MTTKPNDTSAETWRIRRDLLARMDKETRLRTAIDLSESVREIQLEGILARNPAWERAEAVRYLVLKQTGVDLSRAV